MHYRKLGRTGLDVSVIGFGASPLGNVFSDVSSSDAMHAVAAAIDSGINLFDVSPYYGATLAEERLGSALESKRHQIFLATKCGRYGAHTFDFSADTITRQFDASLKRLRTEYVDLLQAHDIEFGEVDQILGETIPALQRLKDQGKVRFIGLTGYWPGLLARIASQGQVDCVLNYCHANLFVDDMSLELIPFAKKSGIGLLNASPLHMGLLAEKPLPPWHPAPPSVREAAVAIRAACRDFGVNAGSLALHVCLGQDAVASTLVGISNAAEVAAACAAIDFTPPPELMEVVHQILKPVHNIVWPSGLEENADTRSGSKEKSDATH